MANSPESNERQSLEIEKEIEKESSRADSEFDRAALEKVLSETLKRHPTDSINQHGMQALRAVALRYPKTKLTNSIVAELVKSILESRFDQLVETSDYSDEMYLEIASAMFEAPVSRKRLLILWSGLLEAAR